MRKETNLMGLAAVICLAMGSAASAAYLNGSVTEATLAEAGAVNEYDAFSGYITHADVGDGTANVSFGLVNGSELGGNDLFIGKGAGANGNQVVVDASTINLTYWAGVGASTSGNSDGGGTGGSNNSLVVQNGGKVYANGSDSYNYNYIGTAGTSGNALLVTGEGSLYRAHRFMRVRGTGNTVTVNDGGMVVSCRGSDNDGGIAVDSGSHIRLAGGYLVTGSDGNGNGPDEVDIQIYDGTNWVELTSLDASARAALGYSSEVADDAAEFNLLTGGLYTDVASSIDFSQTKDVHVFTGGLVVVPEPASLALLGLGVIALLGRGKAER